MKTKRILPFVGLALWAFWSANEYSIQAQYANETPTPVQIAPNAQAALDKMKAAYKNAAFYSSEIKIYSSGLDNSPPAGEAAVSASVAWSKPNKIKVSGTGDDGTTTLISNGTTFWKTSSLFPAVYLQGKVTPTRQLFASALNEVGASDSMLRRLMAGEDPLRRFGSGLQKVELKKIGVRDDKGKNQIATDRVAIVVTFARRKDAGTATFVVGNDGVLRSFRSEQTKNGQPISVREIYDDARFAADDASFEYSIAPDSQMLSAFPAVKYDPRLQVGAAPLPLRARFGWQAGQL